MGFPPIVHPVASIGIKASIGDGSVVLAGAVVGPGASVGECCNVNTRAPLDHHGVLRDYASLAAGVITGGNVSIGEESAVSVGGNYHMKCFVKLDLCRTSGHASSSSGRMVSNSTTH